MAWIAGVDEVGKGSLAGPITIGIAVLDEADTITGLRDSKKLSPKKREAVFAEIARRNVWCAVGNASNVEIDQLGIDEAQRLAARRAVIALHRHGGDAEWPEEWRIDGPWDFLPDRLQGDRRGVQTIVGGDDKVQAISAASVVAKVIRDRHMVAEAEVYPEYGFEKHKGYGTKAHMQAITEHGACKIHRVSWSPFVEKP
jgi:ribonuclease HII